MVGNEGAQYAISDLGDFIYLPGGASRYERKLAWTDRQGKREPLPAPIARYDDVEISPDGRQAVVSIRKGTIGIWIYDFSRATLSPFTTPGSSQAPKWTQNGKRIVYRATRNGYRNVYWKAADGTGEEERLTKGDTLQTPMSSSPDGTLVVFVDINPETADDMWTVSLDGDHKVEPLIVTRFRDRRGRISPNGRWLAYTSTESGREEIYVQRFPGGGGKQLVSTQGGDLSIWSRDGQELFFRNGDKMMAVSISPEDGVISASPRLLFEQRFVQGIGLNYDVAPDGRRFLTVQPVNPELPATHINLVQNWFDEVKRLVPTK